MEGQEKYAFAALIRISRSEQVAAGRAEAVAEQLGHQQRVDVAREHRHRRDDIERVLTDELRELGPPLPVS